MFYTWHVTHDMWHIVGGEYSLKMSATQLLRSGMDSVLMIMNGRMTDSISQSMSDVGDCRTAPDTPGLLIPLFNWYWSPGQVAWAPVLAATSWWPASIIDQIPLADRYISGSVCVTNKITYKLDGVALNIAGLPRWNSTARQNMP